VENIQSPRMTFITRRDRRKDENDNTNERYAKYFGYDGVKGKFSSPLSSQASENHPILLPSFNQHEPEKNGMCQIVSQPYMTTVKTDSQSEYQKFFLAQLTGGVPNDEEINNHNCIPLQILEKRLKKWHKIELS